MSPRARKLVRVLIAGTPGRRAPGVALALAASVWACTSSPALAAASPGARAMPASGMRPVVSLLQVPATALAGAPPAVSLRLLDPVSAAVHVEVAVSSLASRRTVLVVVLGWVPTGNTASVHWPRRSRLGVGDYHVRIIARDRRGAALARLHGDSGVATLTVLPTASPPPPSHAPAPAAPAAPPAAAVTAGAPSPAQLLAAGAVFPVSGPHSFGGPENRFGAPRGNHLHEGQDILAAEGTPVLAPLAGTVITASYQEGGAGYYAAEHTDEGVDFMFAHCRAGSLSVTRGELLAPGQVLCRVGQTGDATAPHLHFEIWVGSWQAPGSYPIDPLPYLEAWEAA